MHSLWLFLLEKRSFSYLLMVALILGGLVSVWIIPKESSPEVIIPVGIVTATLRGASAEDTEKLLTNKIEDEVLNIDGIDKVTSSSREGLAIVTAEFDADADIDKSIQDLKDAVDRAKVSFPAEADEPSVTRVNFADQPILIMSVGIDVPPKEAVALKKKVVDELKDVPGVSRVDAAGVPDREISVVLRKDLLDRYDLGVDQVIGAIASANASLPIGTVTVADVDYPVRFTGSLTDADEISGIPVGSRGGQVVLLRDIALVIDGVGNETTYARQSTGGQPSVRALTFSVYKKSGGDVTKVVDSTLAKVDALKGSILAGSSVVVSFDRGELVMKDLRELSRVGLETIILVILLLVLTIGWRESLVAALSIPLSFVIAFIGLIASGNTINFLSLFSLILAIGILVDSGIVVTEAIHSRTPRLGGPEPAAVASIKEYAWPLIAGTMATVAFFVPLFFLSGIIGQFVASIPFTLIFVLVASLFVALGMVPLLAILLTSRPHKNRFEDFQEEMTRRAIAWYEGFLTRILENRKLQTRFLLGLVITLIITLTFPFIGLVGISLFPQDDQDFIYIAIEKPQGTPIERTDLAVREVEDILYEYPYAESFVSTVGASSGFSDTGSSLGGKLANITVLLPKNRDLTSTQVVEDLRKKLSPVTDADIKILQGNNGPPGGTPVQVKVKGDDLDALSTAADTVEKALRGTPGATDVASSIRDDGTALEVSIDRDKASQLGLTAAQAARILRSAISGVTATTIRANGEDIDVTVRLDLNTDMRTPAAIARATDADIRNIPVATPSGTVLLGSFITVIPSPNRAVIAHEAGERIVTVSSNVADGHTAVDVTNDLKERLSTTSFPASVSVSYGGENEDVQTTFREMVLALLGGTLLALAILVLEFNSIRFTLYLILIIPLSFIGVMTGLALSRQALSFTSMLGVIALAGVIINHAIILLDSILQRLRKDGGKTPLKTIVVESAAVRLRPIFLTTITTAIGMIPLAGVSALWGPLAFTIMFGLLFAMVLTLVFIPVMFYRWPGKKFKEQRDFLKTRP